MASFAPVIAIVGTTGVSKTRLAVELATRFTCASPHWRCSKIINGDAMQCYKGLEILTNKASPEERQSVEHLLMDFRAPGDQYLVTDWVNDAMLSIEDMHHQHETPIVVGGTFYYIQNLLFRNKLASTPHTSMPEEISSREVERTTGSWLADCLETLTPKLVKLWHSLPEAAPSANTDPLLCNDLYSLLQILDPDCAARWHWKDSRRALTSLRIIKQHEIKASDFNTQQQGQQDARYVQILFK
jgi:tRNA dimethylallyltransferase